MSSFFSTRVFLIVINVDDVGGSQPHSFKSSSFSIPTQCGYCKVRIVDVAPENNF